MLIHILMMTHYRRWKAENEIKSWSEFAWSLKKEGKKIPTKPTKLSTLNCFNMLQSLKRKPNQQGLGGICVSVRSISLSLENVTWHSLSSLLGVGFCSNFILEAHTTNCLYYNKSFNMELSFQSPSADTYLSPAAPHTSE